MRTICYLCNRECGPTVYVVSGYIGTYVECAYCHNGIERPEEPELITDTFTTPAPVVTGSRSLDAILDKLTGDYPR